MKKPYYITRRTILNSAIVVAFGLASSSPAKGATLLGPLVQLSTPDPFASCGSSYGYVPDPNAAGVEPMLSVNPANTANIVAIWCAHGMSGIATATSMDGGTTWSSQIHPGSSCARGADPWISFGPGGILYASAGNSELFTLTRSLDGGATWGPLTVPAPPLTSRNDDKMSIAADRTDTRFAYAAWVRFTKAFNGNNSETMLAVTTDSGLTWQAPQSIHQASSGCFNWGHQIVVQPNGTVICAFCEGSYQNNHQTALSLMQSHDHGQTWSGPTQAPMELPLVDPNFQPPNGIVLDPDTGHTVEAHPMFNSIAVDPNNGTLYAVWLDARFTGQQINAIALSASSDGGVTWSAPMQVNQTPTAIPLLNQQAWNPTVQVAADGTVAVSYYDFRNNTSAPGCLTDYWLAYWRPGSGAVTDRFNWREIRLTDTSFDLEQAPGRPIANYAYMVGDYEGLAPTGNGFAALWTQPYAGASAQILFRNITFQ